MFLNNRNEEWNTSEEYEKDTRVVKRECVLSKRCILDIPIFANIVVRRSKALSWLVLYPLDRIELTIGSVICKVKVTTNGMPFKGYIKEIESEVATKNLWDFNNLLNEVLDSGCSKLVIEMTTNECINSYLIEDGSDRYVSVGESDKDKEYVGVTEDEWNDFCYCLNMKDSLFIPLRLLTCIVNSCISTVNICIDGIDLIKEVGSIEFITCNNVLNMYIRGCGREIYTRFDMNYYEDYEDIIEEVWIPFMKNLSFLFSKDLHLKVSLGGERWDRLYCVENSKISLSGSSITINVVGSKS